MSISILCSALEKCNGVETQMWADEGAGASAKAAAHFVHGQVWGVSDDSR